MMIKPLPSTLHYDLINNVSFYNKTITATLDELIRIIGEPYYNANCGTKTSNYQWFLVTENGIPFVVYDYKERKSLKKDEPVEWRIDTLTRQDTEELLPLLITHLMSMLTKY